MNGHAYWYVPNISRLYMNVCVGTEFILKYQQLVFSVIFITLKTVQRLEKVLKCVSGFRYRKNHEAD